jgi:hypothetical protein
VERIVYTEKGFSLFSVFKAIAWDSRSFIYRKEKQKEKKKKLTAKNTRERPDRRAWLALVELQDRVESFEQEPTTSRVGS